MKPVFALLALLLGACAGPSSCTAATKPQAAGYQRPTTPAGPPKMGEVGTFALANDGRASLAARTVSFGQIFRPGEVRPDNTIQVQLDGRAAPTQMDPKALNPDGSVRHAVISVGLPELKAGQTVKGALINGPGGTARAPATYVPIPAVEVVVTLHSESGETQTLTANLVQAAQAQQGGNPWLAGPLAQERRYAADLSKDLQAIFDVYTPTAGPSRVDVSFHHDWVGVSRENELTYDVEIRLNGATVYKASKVEHYPFATWHRLFWTDGGPDIRLVPDLDLLQAAGAIPRYDKRFRIGSAFRNGVEDAGRGDRPPLDSAMITHYMPNTGGRMDIGPLPTWAVVDLLAGNAATRRALLANGDAAGSIPWHLRDRKTRLPLTLDDHPTLWLDPRGEDTLKGVLPETFLSESDGWTLDDAHQPSLTYLPYLLTGRQYYRDELAQQAAYNLLSYEPGYRGGKGGFVMGVNGDAWVQVRAMAWFVRTLANAAYILPADDPLQPYFEEKLTANLRKFVQLYVDERRMKDAGPLEGWAPGAMEQKDTIAPWMQGYLATVLTWTNDMGYSDAGRMAGWMSNFLAGLYTSADEGMDPAKGVAYELPVRDGKTGRLYDNWRDAYKRGEVSYVSSNRLREMFDDYARVMHAALGGTYSITKSPKTAQAYRYLNANLGKIGDPAAGDPTFAILPVTEPEAASR